MERQSQVLRFGRIAGLVGIIAAFALVSVPAAGTSGIGNGLFAYVRGDTYGPLPACTDPSSCGIETHVTHFIYVLNANRLPRVSHPSNRASLPNSFVVSSIDTEILVDGVEQFDGQFIPPPNASPRQFSEQWPSTVRCPGPVGPCNEVLKPAVLPGENTAILYTGWIHGDDEPNGTYVFKFVIHGTLNGNPVDLHASSRPIEMTD